jgi:hypothetical protein
MELKQAYYLSMKATARVAGFRKTVSGKTGVVHVGGV